MVREDRVLSETPVSSYPRGTKDEWWWLASQVHLGELRWEESSLTGSAGHEQTQAGLFWGSSKEGCS